MSYHSSAGQFMELCVDPGKLFIRIDLHHKNITTGFKDWFAWHVDTAQVEVASRVYHFIEPDGNIVGIKTCAGEGTSLMRKSL